MINPRIFLLASAVFVLAVGSQVFAQPAAQKPQTPTTTTTTQPAAVNVPVGKVAVIFSAAFQDPKQGIAKFNVLLTRLNSEFQKTQDDLTQTAARIKQSEDEIANLQSQAAKGAPVDTKAVNSKIEQLDQMKKDYQRKGEDATAQYQRRRGEVFAPLQDDVAKALDAYAKARGITLVIDGSQVEGILYASDNTDITRAFISEYNQKNPATASLTTPK
jgi:Skp family chaperone for outer membrane proteins